MNCLDACCYSDGDMVGYAICNNHPPESVRFAYEKRDKTPYTIIQNQGLTCYVKDPTPVGKVSFVFRHQVLPYAKTAQDFLAQLKWPQLL